MTTGALCFRRLCGLKFLLELKEPLYRVSPLREGVNRMTKNLTLDWDGVAPDSPAPNVLYYRS